MLFNLKFGNHKMTFDVKIAKEKVYEKCVIAGVLG